MVYASRSKTGKKQKKIIITAIILTALVAVSLFWLRTSKKELTQEQSSNSPLIEPTESEQKEEYESIDLQSTIDTWLMKYPANYSIKIYDLQNGQPIGQSNQNEVLFAASLYKIYVAYLSLLDFQNNDQNPDEILIAGQTKKECVDAMIRDSDSPCGEAMLAEMGQANLNQRINDMGMNETNLQSIQTSAADSALLLKYINDRRDLNQENTDFLLDSMLVQDAKFKRGLEAGAPNAKWQTKVGWNEDINYHDIGIMTLPDNRKFAVAILGHGSGSPKPIADFAGTIYSSLMQ